MFKRISRIFKSEAHAALDKIENPTKMIEQGIRELKKDLESTVEVFAEVKAYAVQVKREIDKKEAYVKECEQKAKNVLTQAKNGKIVQVDADDIARNALIEKEKGKKELTRLYNDLEKHAASLQGIESNIEKLKFQILSWENESKMLKARAHLAEANKKVKKQLSRLDFGGTIAMLEKMKTKIEIDETIAETYDEISDNKIEVVTISDVDCEKVEKELEKLKG